MASDLLKSSGKWLAQNTLQGAYQVLVGLAVIAAVTASVSFMKGLWLPWAIVLGCGVALFLAVVANFVSLIIVRHQRHASIENTQPVELKQLPTDTQRPEPNLIALEAARILVSQDTDNTIYQCQRGEALVIGTAYVAVIKNEAGNGLIDKATGVRAHIDLEQVGGPRKKTIQDALWLGSRHRYKDFDIGDTHYLLLAMQPEPEGQICTIENHHTNRAGERVYEPIFSDLRGGIYVATVRLVGGKHGDIQRTFRYHVETKPDLYVEKHPDGPLQIGGSAQTIQPVKNERAELRLDEIQQLYDIKKLEPNLAFVRWSLVVAHEDQHGRIIEGDNNSGSGNFNSIVGEFNNRLDPHRRIRAIQGVSAKLTYSFFDGKNPIEITRGVWLHEGSKVDFGINDTNNLVMATSEGLEDRRIFALNGSYSHRGPRRSELLGNLVRVDVSFIAELEAIILKRAKFMLEITRDDGAFVEARLFELRQWKYEQLLGFIESGIKIAERYPTRDVPNPLAEYGGLAALVDSTEDIERDGDAWAGRVGKFLEAHFSEQHKIRFISEIAASPSRPRGFLEGLLAGIKLLQLLTQEA